MKKPRLLDLFCGAGGAAMGYHRVGFDVVGVDINPQPHFPFPFIEQDAIGLMFRLLGWADVNDNKGNQWVIEDFDVFHASPPCQRFTKKQVHWGRKRTYFPDHPDLLTPIRDLLKETGRPYVIENVNGSPMDATLMLCGTMFGLKIIKHRFFEMNFAIPLLAPKVCNHANVYNPWQGIGRTAVKMREAMDIDWMPTAGGASRKAGYTGDLYNAIPPAYTEYIGNYLLKAVLNGRGNNSDNL